MNSIFLSPQITIELFLEFFVLFAFTFAIMQAIGIKKLLHQKSTIESNYELEKKTALFNALVGLSLIIKISLFILFIYASDKLSAIVPGAMCATGVFNANSYGAWVVGFKLFVLLVASLWLLVNNEEKTTIQNFYLEKKLYLFGVIYLFLLVELFLTLLFLGSIDTALPVSCCSSKKLNLLSNSLPFGLSENTLLSLFYSSFLLLWITVLKKLKIAFALSFAIFLILSYFSIVYYFAPHIYGNPFHHCAYCILQNHYNYAGYFIYGSLFLSTYYAIGFIFFTFMQNSHKKILFFTTLFIFLANIFKTFTQA